MKKFLNISIRVGLMAGAIFFCLPASSADNAELSKVREQIQQKKQEITTQKKSLNDLHAQLQQDEVAIDQINQRLSNSQKKLTLTRQQLRQLETRGRELSAQLNEQEALLASQLDHAYRMGHHDYLKLMLNQQNPAAVGRALDYYGYFNQARLDAIKKIRATQEQLSKNKEQTRKTTDSLSEQVQGQQQDQLELKKRQQAREKTADELKKSLNQDQQQLTKLQTAEKEMQRKIEEARKKLEEERARKKKEALAKARAEARKKGKSEAAAAKQAEARIAAAEGDHKGLGKLRGHLPWPVRGHLVRRFGEHRSGEVAWKGLLIGSATGTAVKAVADGDVVFADWLDGFGHVLVIDHGNGYLSLYGNNSHLNKHSGDSVKRGETIAEVGNSGGQPESGLYFEIRWQGKPVEPQAWLSR